MTSKNSFLADAAENMRRRIWVPVLFIILHFIQYTVLTGIDLSQYTANHREMMSSLFTMNLQLRLLEIFSIRNGIFLAVVFGLISAWQGFSYLFNKSKVDMYHSVPVHKGRRFAVITAGSIFIYLASAIINISIGLLVAGGFGYMDGNIVLRAYESVFYNLIIFLAAYATALLSVMLTGRLLVSIMGTGVIALAEFALASGIYMDTELFFHNFSLGLGNWEYVIYRSYISPLPLGVRLGILYIPDYYDTMPPAMVTGSNAADVLRLIILIILYFILSYRLYRRRPSESAGSSMVFQASKFPIKTVVLTSAVICMGALFYTATNKNMAMLVFGMVLTLFLSHLLVEVIYEYDLKAALGHYHALLAAAMISAAFTAVFALDILGIDSYVPDRADVEYASVYSYYGMNGRYDWDYGTEGRSLYNMEEHTLENMKLYDNDTLEDLCVMAVDGLKLSGRSSDNSGLKLRRLSVKYHLTSGRDVYRYITLDMDVHGRALAGIYASKEYKTSVWQIFDDRMLANAYRIDGTYNTDNAAVDIDFGDTADIIRAYREDCLKLSPETLYSERPIGILNLRITRSSEDGYSFTWKYPVYKEYSDTLALLDAGDGAYGKPLQALAPGIEYIAVDVTVNYNKYWDGQDTKMSYDTESLFFSDEADIEYILSHMILSDVTEYCLSEDSGDYCYVYPYYGSYGSAGNSRDFLRLQTYVIYADDLEPIIDHGQKEVGDHREM